MFSTQILIEVKVDVLKPYFEVDTEVCMVDIINMKVSLMEVDKETLEEEQVVEVVVEIIKVNNQITTQTATTVGNVATPLWPSVRMKLTLPKLGIWSPPGLPNV